MPAPPAYIVDGSFGAQHGGWTDGRTDNMFQPVCLETCGWPARERKLQHRGEANKHMMPLCPTPLYCRVGNVFDLFLTSRPTKVETPFLYDFNVYELSKPKTNGRLILMQFLLNVIGQSLPEQDKHSYLFKSLIITPRRCLVFIIC